MINDQNILLQIKSELEKMNQKLDQLLECQLEDRRNLWKILTLTILGAFMLVGIKLFI